MYVQLIALIFVSYLIYRLITRNWNFFIDRDIQCYRGLPIIGSFYKLVIGSDALPNIITEIYSKFPNEELIGLYEFFGKKIVMLRDPELIKKITIKDFDHFTDHRFNIDKNIEPLFGRSVLIMCDQEWKMMRSTLSPAFTGNKMRLMFTLINENSNDFVSYLNECVSSSSSAQKSMIYELKDLFSRYSTDTIATCAFGLKTNSVKHRMNEFFLSGKIITNFDGLQGAKLLGYSSLPEVMKFFRIKLIPTKYYNYFRNVVLDTFRYREQNNVIRHDMINLLLQTKSGNSNELGAVVHESDDMGKLNNKLKVWEDDDFVAQCMIFFFAGFDTVSTLLCFTIYELALNMDIQNRLFTETNETAADLTYENIQNLKYLDMILSETLRKWSPLTLTDRKVTKPYVLETTSGKSIHLNVGDAILIPICSIHLDSKYYPNPEKFDPDRFSDENKHKILPEAYIPFGSGPRICIGSRFALLECKSVLFYLIKSFEFHVCTQTQIPFKYRCRTSSVDAENGFWIEFKNRK